MTEKTDTADIANIVHSFRGIVEFLRPWVVEIMAEERAKEGARGPSNGAKYLKKKDAAGRIGIGATKFDELVAAGEIKRTTVAGMPMYSAAEVDRYCRRCEQQGA